MSEDHINKGVQKEILDRLHARKGHFRLESGHHGTLWLELDSLFLRPQAIQPFVLELTRKVSSFSVEAVCGPMVGGALLAQNIALELGVEFLYTERIVAQNPDILYAAAYRLPPHFRAAIRGKKVAIVDDVINAGSVVRGTLTELESAGVRPVVVGTLLVLGETGQKYLTERHLPLRSISRLANEIWTPEACPLCASKIPVDKSG